MYIMTCDPINGPCNGTIAGTVTNSSGGALSGATVFTNPGGFLAVTASDGTYSLMADSDITYTVTALKTGYDQISTTVTVLSNKTIAQNFMLPASPKGTISGKVTTSGGSGLKDVTVSTDLGGYRATTSWSGAYSLSVTPGTYIVTASKSGYAKNSTVVTVSPGQTVTTNLILTTTTARGTITGKVTDDSGLVALSGAAISTDAGGYTAIAAADGTYSLSVNPGTYIVTARKTGYATNSKTATVYSYKTATVNIAMVVLPPGTISGTVIDSGGIAISGATVSTNTGGYVTTTAMNGTYSLTNVDAGTYTVTASKGGYTNGSATVTVSSMLIVTANITLTVATTTGKISGTVTTSGGAALAGATVATNTGGYATTSASDGTYSLTVITGTYTVTASKSGYNTINTTAAVAANQTLTINFALTALPAMISGTVTDAGGVAISGATVSTNTGGYTAATAVDGTYSLTNVNVGTYTVTASKSGFISSSVTMPLSAGAMLLQNFMLTALPGKISGKVTDAGGVAISGATISTNSGGYSATTATDGTYSLSNVVAGTYTVTASRSGYTSNSTSATVVAGQAVTSNITLTAVPSKGTISGTVKDTHGDSLSNVTVSTNSGGYTTTTSSSGTYTLTVNPGSYTVTASKSGYKSASRTVTVQSNQTTSANFTLDQSYWH